ncbi:LysR substrate-binding domain-containing protein [Thaumasiovibrio sp. DFM-14]|uniref:LysR substrate-binding domain-containing protein n=1 Tax=Thaumasiovibrio sp. DFM-14 TaxID=3384792 RepID=UPI0039A14D8A
MIHNGWEFYQGEQKINGWEFYQGEQKIKVRVKSDRAVNDGDIVRRWCLDGVGIAKKSAIDVSADLLAGRLQRVMPGYHIPVTEMWMVLPSRQLITPAVRLIRDALKNKINELRGQLIKEGRLSEEEWPAFE